MKKIKLRVSEIKRPTADAILIYLETENGERINYAAGQFITFIFDNKERELRRSYSIFTTPGVDSELGVLVKRLANGEVSRYLIDHLKPGQVLEAIPPSGRFTLPDSAADDEELVFITAGSGISPVFSLLKEALYFREHQKVSLLYQSRDEHSILFSGELMSLQSKFKSRLMWTNFLSSPSGHETRPLRLNNTMLEQLLTGVNHTIDNSRFFLCGPPAFMRMCQFVLHFLKVPVERIHREVFFLENMPASPLVHEKVPRQVELDWQHEHFSFTVQYPQSILDAALEEGILLPYSCRGGRCSACAVKCTTGKVVMSVNEVLTERDLQQGWVLTCTGYPQTDLVLHYP